MGEREDLVYQAKLAEQAERYDGKPHFVSGAGSEWDMFAAGIFFFSQLANINRALLTLGS